MPPVVYGQLSFTYDPKKLLRDVAVELNTTEESLIDAFGTGSTSGAEALADAINRWNNRLYSSLPEFGITSALLTVPAKSTWVLLPTAMWATSLVKVQVWDFNQPWHRRNIRILPTIEYHSLPEGYRNGQLQAFVPEYVALSDDGQSLLIAPVLNATRTLVIHHRAKLDVVTAASLTTSTSIRLPVPDEVMDTYCKFIAIEIGQLRQMVDAVQFLRRQIRYAEGDMAPRLLIDQIEALTNTVDPQSMIYTRNGTLPPNSLTAQPAAGTGYFSPFRPRGIF